MGDRKKGRLSQIDGKGASNENTVVDDLQLHSSRSRSTSPLQVDLSKPRSTALDIRKTENKVGVQEVVNLDDDLDLEILEEVTSIPGTSLYASDSESESSESEEALDLEDENDESASLVSGKMNILYSHGSFFLWDAEDEVYSENRKLDKDQEETMRHLLDNIVNVGSIHNPAALPYVQMLREECRIVGKLVGCLPRAPRQNIQLGLPLQLMPEEAKLLVDIEAATVVVEKSVSEILANTRKAAFDNIRQQNFQIQQCLYKEHRKEEVSHRMDSIIAGKKAKKRKLQEEFNQSNQVSAATSEREKSGSRSTSSDEKNGKTEDNEDINSLTVDDIVTTEISEEHSFIQIFTQNPWKQSLMPFKVWAYPTTERDMLRYLVFKDLWGKGFYLTSGSKFGGDFLVYPGDPARYHSHYIAVCKGQFDEMPCLDLVSLGRLSSNVRKTALLCALDRNRKVTYTSFTWTGIS